MSTLADTSAFSRFQNLYTVVNSSDKSVIDFRNFVQLFFENHIFKIRIVLQLDS